MPSLVLPDADIFFLLQDKLYEPERSDPDSTSFASAVGSVWIVYAETLIFCNNFILRVTPM